MDENQNEINENEENSKDLINKRNDKLIYKSTFNRIGFTLIVSFYLIGIGALVGFILLGIYTDSSFWIFMILFPLFLIVLSSVFSCAITLYNSIIIDYELGLIITKTQKFFCCLSQTNSIGLIEIEQIIIQINQNIHYSNDGVYYNCFDVIFKLLNGNEIKGIDGLIDKKNESGKVIDFIKKNIPKTIPISGDLVEKGQLTNDIDSKQLSHIPIISL